MLSYSKLLDLDRQLKGLPEGSPINPKTLELGRQFELRALQPELYEPSNDEFYVTTSRMMQSLEQNQVYISFMQPEGKSQHSYYWTCKHTGVKCMAKVDRKISNSKMDLKTTSCKSQQEFEAAVTAYSYDMQGAFYMDSSPTDFYFIIGVQKKFPYNTYSLCYAPTNKEIITAREKYVTIINESIAKELLHL